MDARVTQVEGGPGDGGEKFIRERVLPGVRERDGFEGALNVVDRDSGRGYSILFWRDSEALKATDELAASFRDEAQGQGYEPSLLGQFEVVALDTSGGDPQVARLVRTSGGGDMASFIREQVSPTYQDRDGYLGVIGMSAGDQGIGISLWASDEAFDGAEDAMQQVGQALEGAGFQREGLERLAVAISELP